MQPIAGTQSVSRAYTVGGNSFFALHEVSMQAQPGELLVIRGRSGSGKTTLLNLLAGLDQPTSGQVFFKGKNMAAMDAGQRDRLRRKEIGVVFQSLALFPYLTAQENVEAALRIGGHQAGRLKAVSREWLGFVGLDGRRQHLPDQLSGGEQQRVAIARAAARHPDLLLADEPTAMLDTRTGQQVMALFSQLATEKNICVVLTTHNPSILQYAHRIYTLENGRMVANE